MKPGEFDDIDGRWLADAKVGDFSTMPNLFTWDQSVKFAHIIDGYGVAGGVEQCMARSRNAASADAPQTARPRGSARSPRGHPGRARCRSRFACGLDGSCIAGDCTRRMSDRVPGEVAALIEVSLAEGTRRVYRTDLAHFTAWGGQMPSEPTLVASYLAAHGGDAQRRHPRPPHRDDLKGARGEGIAQPLPVGNRSRHHAGRQAHVRGRATSGEGAPA